MSLNTGKEAAIIQWFNSLTTSGLEDLVQLSDGSKLYKICVEFWPESLPASLNEETTSLSPEYAKVKQLIDGFFSVESEELINYLECKLGNKLELAKLSLFLLSIVVLHYLKSGNPALATLTHLDQQIQLDIEECLSLITDTSNVIQKSEIHKVLSRPAACKSSPRKADGFSSAVITPGQAVTPGPRKRGRKRKFPVEISEEFVKSPLQNFLKSPKTRDWAIILQKNKEFANLKSELYVKDTEIENLKLRIENLQKDLEKQKKETELQKTEFRNWQLEAAKDEKTEKEKVEKLEKEKSELFNKIDVLKSDIKSLESENKQLCIELKNANESKVSVPHTSKDSNLSDMVAALEFQLHEKSKDIENLQRNIEEVRTDLDHQAKLNTLREDRLREVLEELEVNKVAESPGEQLGEIIEADYRNLIERYHEMKRRLDEDEAYIKKLKDENARLKKILETKSTKLKNLEKEYAACSEKLSYYAKLLDRVVEKNEEEESLKADNVVASNNDSNETPTNDKSMAIQDVNNLQTPTDLCATDANENTCQLLCSDGEPSECSPRFENSNPSCSQLNKSNTEVLGINIVPETMRRMAITIAADVFNAIGQRSISCDVNNSLAHNATNEERAPNGVLNKDYIEFFQLIKQFFLKRFNVDIPLKEINEKVECEAVKNLTVSSECTLKLCEIESNFSSIVETLTKENSELKQKISDCMNLQEEQSSEMQDLQQHCKILEQNYEEKKGDVEKLKEKLKKYKQYSGEMYKLQEKYAALKNAFIGLEDRHKQLSEKCNTQSKLLDSLTEEKKQLHDDLVREKEAKKSISAMVSKLNCKVLYLNSASHELSKKLDAEKEKNAKLLEEKKLYFAFHGSEEDKKEVIRESFMKEISSMNSNSSHSKNALEGRRFTVDGEWFKNEGNHQLGDIRENDSSYISNSSLCGPFFNKSLHGALPLYNDDEEGYFNHSSVMERKKEIFNLPVKFDRCNRMKELQRRNTLCLPHLKSSYALELQCFSPGRVDPEVVNKPLETSKLPQQNPSHLSRSSTQINRHSRISQPLPKRRKISGGGSTNTTLANEQKNSAAAKKPAKVLKTPSKVLKTPSSLRRLMHIHKVKADKAKSSLKR